MDNPWAPYSTGAGTGVMKQVFTVTKGNKRHTFLQTTLKVSMVTRGIFLDDEIRTMLRRIYAPGDGPDELCIADTFTQRCLRTQKNGLNSSMMGFMVQDKQRAFIGWSSTEFFNMVNDIFPTEKDMGVLRIYDTIVELIRSETMLEPVRPIIPCDKWNVNRAKGGKVRWNDCYLSTTPDQADPQFLGEIDVSSVALITDILGDAKSDTNAVALNATGQNWYIFNRTWIDQLLLSRAFLVGGDASTVSLLVHHNEAAISYLQLLLILIPPVLALTAFALMLKDKSGYYKSSLFAPLATTTHLGGQTTDHSCETVRYIKCPPNLVLQRSEEHIRINTDDGAYILSSRELLKGDQRGGASADASHQNEDPVLPSPGLSA